MRIVVARRTPFYSMPALPFRELATRLRVVMLRCLAAIALAGALLYLNVARAEVACATHEQAAAVEEGQTDHGSSGHHGAHGEVNGPPQTDNDQQNCETPVQQNCCVALVSCWLAIGLAESMTAEYVPTHEAAVAALNEIPLSRVSTPDPPPPKA